MIQRLNGSIHPVEVMTVWPADQPLLMLHSGRVHHRWARWSILATPVATYRFDDKSHWIGEPPAELARIEFTNDPLRDVDAILNATNIDHTRLTANQPPSQIPFLGGWIGYFSYDLGRIIEPQAQTGSTGDHNSGWPLIELGYCPAALIYDHVEQTWFSVGNSDLPMHVSRSGGGDSKLFALGPLVADIDPDHYISMVSRTIEYIGAGDIFQANIAQRFSAEFQGSTRELCRAAFDCNLPWYGAYLELPEGLTEAQSPCRTIVSLSPELFLHTDFRTRQITTRPIKGTRPITGEVQELIESPKDAAELHMIIDLMRNDLGRVCEFGSVKVPNPRTIETHPTVHHGVGEVTGQLREDVRFVDLLRATFPGGSVTGAPKIRAMQIIDDLEPVPRGPYCGAIGAISNCGSTSLSIAIRTMLITGWAVLGRFDQLTDARLNFSAGAGIVADSDPLSEYRESIDKTAAPRQILGDSANRASRHAPRYSAETSGPITNLPAMT